MLVSTVTLHLSARALQEHRRNSGRRKRCRQGGPGARPAIDDRDYRIALQRAESDLAAQRAAANAARTQIPIASRLRPATLTSVQAAGVAKRRPA